MGEGRIKDLMRYFHLSENEFADALEAELRSPDFKPTGLYTRTIDAICGIFKVSPEWLKYGTGTMFLSEEGA